MVSVVYLLALISNIFSTARPNHRFAQYANIHHSHGNTTTTTTVTVRWKMRRGNQLMHSTFNQIWRHRIVTLLKTLFYVENDFFRHGSGAMSTVFECLLPLVIHCSASFIAVGINWSRKHDQQCRRLVKFHNLRFIIVLVNRSVGVHFITNEDVFYSKDASRKELNIFNLGVSQSLAHIIVAMLCFKNATPLFLRKWMLF